VDEDDAEVRVPDAPPVSLDEFCTRHTSEDNASFNRVLAKSNALKAKKARWIHEQVTGASRLTAADARPNTDGYGTTGQDTLTLEYRAEKANNTLYSDSAYQPNVALTAREVAQTSKGPPKEICKMNTRLIPAQAVANSASSSEASTPAASRQATPNRGGRATPFGWEHATPQATLAQRGYSYMPSPSPVPGEGPEASPFMTWGHIDSTPLRLELEDTSLDPQLGEPGFTMNKVPVRERVNRKLVQGTKPPASPRVAGRIGVLASPRLGTPGAKVGRLSEAALKLVKSASKTVSTVGVDTQLRQSYRANTPSHSASKSRVSMHTPGSHPRSTSDVSTPSKGHTPHGPSGGLLVTPKRVADSDPSNGASKRLHTGSVSKPSITDNLLDINLLDMI